jgi:hypothetical protein
VHISARLREPGGPSNDPATRLSSSIARAMPKNP